jgi:hypothetical protein
MLRRAVVGELMIGLLTVAILLGLFMASRPETDPADAVGPAIYRQIACGMERSAVWESVGFPPGDYDPDAVGRPLSMGPFGETVGHWGIDAENDLEQGRRVARTTDGEEVTLDRWNGRRYCIHVVFDRDGKAAGCTLYRPFPDADRAEQSPLANLLWRAKRQWRKWFPE